MLEIRCPRCEAQISGLLCDYIRWRSDRRKCPSCGVGLEISNGLVCFGLCGLIFAITFILVGSLFVSAMNLGIGKIWVGLVVAMVLCWGLMPIIVRLLGRWRVSRYGSAASVSASKWSGIAHISRWVFIVAVLGTGIIVVLRYRGLFQDVSRAESGLYATEDFLAAVGLTAVVGFGIAGVAVIVYLFALFMRRKARMAEKQEKLALDGE
jgi:hypothetical protein